MQQDLTIKATVYELLVRKIDYFKAFAQVTEFKRQVNPKGQFKTEKWLQVEILMHLRSYGAKVRPEYGARRWDIYIESGLMTNAPFFLALDCLSDSGQSANRDYKNVKEDIDSVLKPGTNKGEACVALVLPFSSPTNRREKYRLAMLDSIQKHPRYSALCISEQKIPYEASTQDGITLVWIERRKR